MTGFCPAQKILVQPPAAKVVTMQEDEQQAELHSWKEKMFAGFLLHVSCIAFL